MRTPDAGCQPIDDSMWEEAPEITHWAQPEYPEIARRTQQEGTVMIYVQLAPDGLIASARVCDSSGSRLLDEAAMDAAMHSRYKTAMRDGVPVAASLNVPFSFRLQER